MMWESPLLQWQQNLLEVDHVLKAHKRLVFIHTSDVKTDEVGALGSEAATGDATAENTEQRP